MNKKAYILFLVLSIALLSTTGCLKKMATAKNVTDDDIETHEEGYFNIPPFTLFDWHTREGLWAYKTDKVHLKDKHSIKIKITKPNYLDITGMPTGFTPHKQYLVSLWIKTVDVTGGGIIVRFAHGMPKNGIEYSDTITGTKDWTKIQYNYTPKERETTMHLGIIVGSKNQLVTGTIYIGDLLIKQI
jgi:hypothetical protein